MNTNQRIQLSPLLIVVGVVALLLTACLNTSFSTDTTYRLNFSTDTLRFDTIFTTIGTSRRTIMVYNPNPEALRINKVKLAGGQESPFFINVDGRVGSEFDNLEILKKDSLHLFVGVNIDPNNQDSPILIKDSIEFLINGIAQDIKLEAYGRDVIILNSKQIATDTQFTPNKPYLIYDTLCVLPQVTLELLAGTSLYFHHKATLQVEGKLLANGTQQHPITLRGDRLDSLFAGLPYDYLAGQWQGVRFGAESFDNHLEHTHLRGATTAIAIDSSRTDLSKIVIANSIIHNTSAHLIESCDSKIEIYNSELSNAGGALLYLQGGEALLTHCTLANYYKFDIITTPMLMLTNYNRKNNTLHPLHRAELRNCILYGSTSDLQLDPSDDNGCAMNYLFDHCLFKSNGEDDTQFISTLWNSDPKFRNTGEEYLFDYQLDSLSPARQAGNPAWSTLPPFDIDMNGVSRNNQSAPDLGAYQYVEEATL